MAGVRNVTRVLQMWTAVLESGKAVTLAVFLIYMVDALCHPISTKILKCWNLEAVCMCVDMKIYLSENACSQIQCVRVDSCTLSMTRSVNMENKNFGSSK